MVAVTLDPGLHLTDDMQETLLKVCQRVPIFISPRKFMPFTRGLGANFLSSGTSTGVILNKDRHRYPNPPPALVNEQG